MRRYLYTLSATNSEPRAYERNRRYSIQKADDEIKGLCSIAERVVAMRLDDFKADCWSTPLREMFAVRIGARFLYARCMYRRTVFICAVFIGAHDLCARGMYARAASLSQGIRYL